jgi:hypothetical protein
VLSGSTGASRSKRSASSALQQRANRPSRPHRRPSRELEAVRRTGIVALHVAVITQVSLDQNLPRSVKLRTIVDEQRWPGLTRSVASWISNRPYVEQTLAPCRSGKPKPGLSRGGAGGLLPSGGVGRRQPCSWSVLSAPIVTRE